MALLAVVLGLSTLLVGLRHERVAIIGGYVIVGLLVLAAFA